MGIDTLLTLHITYIIKYARNFSGNMNSKSSEDDELEELLNDTNAIPLQKILASFNQNSKANASLPAKILIMTDHAVETLKFNINHDLAIVKINGPKYSGPNYKKRKFGEKETRKLAKSFFFFSKKS